MSPQPSAASAADDLTIALPDGRELGVRSWPGSGEPLVLLHGLLADARDWDDLAIASGRPCLAVDLPGFGRSHLPTRPRISAYAEDVVSGLERLAAGPFGLVGHSLGGAVAAAMAERSPAATSGLALLAPAGFGRIPLAELVAVPGFRDVTRRLLPLALGSSLALGVAYRTFVTNGERIDSGILARTKASAPTAVEAARRATEAVVAAGLSKRGFSRRGVVYDGPVSVLWGACDRVVPPAHADAVVEALPQARVDVWPGMGHHPQRERPLELSAFVERALPPAQATAPTGASTRSVSSPRRVA